MKKWEVRAQLPAKGLEGIAVVNVPESIEEAVQMFGGDVVLQNALRNWTVTLQAGIRRCLEKGMSNEEIQEKFKDAKMGAAVVIGGVRDPLQAALAKAASMTPEELNQFIAALKAKVKAPATK